MCPPSEAADGDAGWGPDELDLDLAPQLVVVIDSSTIIEIKRQVPLDEQWTLFEQMMTLVKQGRLVFPSQVHREVAREKHPDMPGVWCGEAVKSVTAPDPAEETLVEILPAIEQLVDVNAEPEQEPADPFVAAMAYELRAAGYDLAVATEDSIDRLPLKIALTTACETLGLTWWNCQTFIAWIRSTVNSEDA